MHGVVRWRIVDLCQWIFEEFRVVVAKQNIERESRAIGYRSSRLVPVITSRLRARSRILKSFPARLDEIGREKGVEPAAIEVWFADEARIGRRTRSPGVGPSTARVQARRRTNEPPRLISSARSAPSTEGCSPRHAQMQHRGHEPAPGRNRRSDRAGRTAALLVDQAGWHLSGRLVMPPNITLIPLPAKCPELNPQENVWQFLRDDWLSNRIFKSSTMSSTSAARLGTTSSITLADHVHRPSQLGPWVLINEFLVRFVKPAA